MTTYFEEDKYLLEEIFFRFDGASYRGRGTMTWKPDVGFHIEASLDRYGKPLPEKISLGGGSAIKAMDAPSILMKPHGYDKAIAPNVSSIDDLNILLNRHLSVDFDRVFFFLHSQPFKNTQKFAGSALYNIAKKPILPDVLRSETRINNDVIKYSSSRRAISHEASQKQTLSGHMITDDTLDLKWVLLPPHWTKRHCWQWAESVRYAISILLGQTAQLLQRETTVGPHRRIEQRKRMLAKSLWPLLPFADNHLLHKNDFVQLTEFFTRDSTEARICRKIFDQMAEASRQQTLEAAQLILSTILEAVLRTLYKTKKTRGFPKKYITQFRQQYLSQEWSQACDRALDVFADLRHRNAHPCWLTSESVNWTTESFEKDLNDMAFLSQFYGYMIKALAGLKGLQPTFKN